MQAERSSQEESELKLDGRVSMEGDDGTDAELGPPVHPPTENLMFNSIDDLMAHIQKWGAQHGYCFIKRSASNYRKFPDSTDRRATSYLICCDRGDSRPSTSKGLRRVNSRKCDCPWKARASANKYNEWKWTLTVKDPHHNHPPSEDIADHPIMRRLSPLQMVLLQMMSQTSEISAHAAADVLRRNPGDGGSTDFTMTDIYNIRKRIRSQPVDNRQLTEKFAGILRETPGAHYKFTFDDDGRLKEAVWTYPDSAKDSMADVHVETGFGRQSASLPRMSQLVDDSDGIPTDPLLIASQAAQAVQAAQVVDSVQGVPNVPGVQDVRPAAGPMRHHHSIAPNATHPYLNSRWRTYTPDIMSRTGNLDADNDTMKLE